MLKWSLLILVVAAACQETRHEARIASAPMTDVDNAYDAAARIKLPERKTQEWDDLHNLVRLSDNIVVGGEPLTDAALARIAGMGVKTILSVDGKVPDSPCATRLGMRYVHVPIRYKGLTPDQLTRIAKTFRELDGPFYVHCFHGKHRGPAGAAVGRLVIDGASREQALAEMRQWCGTAKKYEGLFHTIATAPMPAAEDTEALAWNFPAAQSSGGLRNDMVALTRHFDNIKALAANGWKIDPEHPDLDPVRETEILYGFFTRMKQLEAARKAPADFHEWMDATETDTLALKQALKRGATTDANKAFARVKKTCGACHASYRNE